MNIVGRGNLISQIPFQEIRRFSNPNKHAKRNKVIRNGKSVRGPIDDRLKSILLSCHLGKKHSDETKIKMSKSQLAVSKEIKQKRADNTKKYYSLNPGLKSKHTSHPMSEENKMKMSIRMKKQNPSEHTRQKRSETLKALWKNPDHVKKMCSAVKYVSKPENYIAEVLNDIGILYERQRPITNIIDAYPCDFYIEKYNTIIEVDGIYWHNYPHGRDIDRRRNLQIVNAGYRILRIWECDIEESRSLIINFIRQIDCAFNKKVA